MKDRDLGALLRRLRNDRGLTLADVAGRTGLSESLVSKRERSKVKITAGDLGRFAEALGLSDAERLELLQAAGEEAA